jgi:hypothetical protein
MDSAGDIYLVGLAIGSTSWSGIVIKTSPTGTIIWQKQLTQFFYPYFTTEAKFIGIDSGDNVYVLVQGDTVDGRKNTLIKFNSAGTVQWQKEMSNYFSVLFVTGGIDSADNVYLMSVYDSGSGAINSIMKFNSSGTFQWGKEISLAMTAFTADNDGNIYLGGSTFGIGETYNNAIFLKYDSSGTLVWSYELNTYNPYTGLINSMCFKDNKIDFTGSLYVLDPGYYFGMNGQITTDGDFLWMSNFYDTNFETSGTYPVQGLRVVSKSSNALIFAGTSTDLSNAPITLFGRIPSDGSTPAGLYEFPSGNSVFYTSNSAFMDGPVTFDDSSFTISTTTGSVTVSGTVLSTGTTSITSESVQI